MNANPQGSNPATSAIRPPQLIRSLVGGFNAAANNIVLLALPVLLDLLLWFGPRLSLRKLFGPAMAEMLRFTRQNSQPEMAPLLDNFETLWEQFLARFNLLSMLNTFPVGVPSQMAGMMPDSNPLGGPRTYDLQSYGQLILGWLGLTLLGFLLGSLYFAMVATATSGKSRRAGVTGASADDCLSAGTPALKPATLGWQALQVLLMNLLLLATVLVVMVPAAMISTLVALISPLLGQFVLLLVSFFVVWVLFPLIFTPHGIFACGQSVLNAIINSARVVRFSLPSTGLFLIMLVVLNQGLGALWNTAPVNSWLGLAGIFGRAFISTALLAASFFYYRSGLQYQQSLRRSTTPA